MIDLDKGRVLGVGGIFFRSKDPARLGEWYAEHLGFEDEAWGETLSLIHISEPTRPPSTTSMPSSA